MHEGCNQLAVTRSQLSGEISIPASKSQTLRAVLFASLAKGESAVHNALSSPDVTAMIKACRQFGAKIDQVGDQKLIVIGCAGQLAAGNHEIDVGNSGIALRFLAGVAALGSREVFITGDESIQNNRPMNELADGLQQLGARIEWCKRSGFAPLKIDGPIRPGKARIQGLDSQPVSALLIAAGLSVGEYEIVVEHPGERPWIDLTLSWLDRFGIRYQQAGYSKYHVHGTGAIESFDYHVPGDLSSCAFPVIAALITDSALTINNVDLSDLQGDKKLFTVLKTMGAHIEDRPGSRQLIVHRGSQLKGIIVDINDCIDAIVALSIVACFAQGETTIINAAVARDKECNRIEALTCELRKMGGDIEERPDGLVIRGAVLRGANVDSHGDHRMAMGLSVAGLAAEGTTEVSGVMCIEKTYPHFVEAFRDLGANMEIAQCVYI